MEIAVGSRGNRKCGRAGGGTLAANFGKKWEKRRTGEKGFYQYDSSDGTYQAVETPTEQVKEKTNESALSKIGNFIADHTLFVLIAAGAFVLILLILMIIFAIKLVHRNQELDDLYDEYDIPFEEEEEKPAKKKKNRKAEKEPDDGFRL